MPIISFCNYNRLNYVRLMLSLEITDGNAVTQDVSHSGVIAPDPDISSFSHRPNELSEELVRTVALLHQRAAESHSATGLSRTSSGISSSRRRLGRRSSHVSFAIYTNIEFVRFLSFIRNVSGSQISCTLGGMCVIRCTFIVQKVVCIIFFFLVNLPRSFPKLLRI